MKLASIPFGFVGDDDLNPEEREKIYSLKTSVLLAAGKCLIH